jgi:hypothetical protein
MTLEAVVLSVSADEWTRTAPPRACAIVAKAPSYSATVLTPTV